MRARFQCSPWAALEHLIRTFDLNVCSYTGSRSQPLWRHRVVSQIRRSASRFRMLCRRSLRGPSSARPPSCSLVALAAVLVLRGPSVSQSFSVDESRWIATSRYFWITFVDRDLFGPAWQPNYLVYTHPPVARYVIGFGLWLQGWQPDQLNGRYDSLQSRAFNDRAGQRPRSRPAPGGPPRDVRVRRRLGRAGVRRRPRPRRAVGGARGGGVRARQPAAHDRLDPRPRRVDRRGVRSAGAGARAARSCRRSAGSAPVAGCRWRSAPRWRWPPPPS